MNTDEERVVGIVVAGASAIVLQMLRLAAEQSRHQKRKRYRLRDERVCEPKNSTMQRLLASYDDGVYRFLFRIPKKYFQRLLDKFDPIWSSLKLKSCTELQRKRKRKVNGRLALGLVLRYFVTSTESTDTSFNYGLIASTFSKYLRHGIECLHKALDEFAESNFFTPSVEMMKYYSDIITYKSRGALTNIWGTSDGICLRFERSSNVQKEGHNYSGFKKRPCKKLVVVFAPDGSICGAKWDVGTAHDGHLWGPLAAKIFVRQRQSGIDPLLRILGDSAYKQSPVCLQCTEKHATDDIHIDTMRSFRNDAEIGLGGILRGVRRLHVKLPADDDDMVDSVISIALKFTNFRVRICRQGQLREKYNAAINRVSKAWGFVCDSESDESSDSEGECDECDESDSDV